MYKLYMKVVVTLVSLFIFTTLVSSAYASFYDRIKERSENSSTDNEIQKDKKSVKINLEIRKKAQGISVQSKGLLEEDTNTSTDETLAEEQVVDAVVSADSKN